MPEPIVHDAAEAARLEHGAALILDPLSEYLDEAGIGSGEIVATELGDGHSNLTFLLSRGEERVVLRRPPRGALGASANDVLRESQVLEALAETAVPVPAVLARCEDPTLVGAPFFLMSYVPGVAVNDRLPAGTDPAVGPETVAAETVAALVTLHAAELSADGLGAFGRPSGYLERQLRRFGSLLETNATRPLPELERVADWLAANLPESRSTTFVHGDFRLGNLLFGPGLRLAAVLDWEMATVGDPLADLGYLTATWAEPGDAEHPMLALSAATRGAHFPRRADLARAYSEATGRQIENLRWFQVLALWKSAIFLEGSYRRFREGAGTDPYFGSLREGVPVLAQTALRWAEDDDPRSPRAD